MEGRLSGRMYSNGGVGMLGLDMPLHQQIQPQNPQIQLQKHQQQIMGSNTQLSMKKPTNYISYYNNPTPNPNPTPTPTPTHTQNPCVKTKTQLTNSDEDEPGCVNDHENTSIDEKRKGGGNISLWQRMKWTDNMVRLLIMAVYYIGDEVGNEVGPDKKKSGSGGGCGLLQKKGKWKSVSKAMMEKGFYVSPQQCEDKFNDLNKRYKRVNDILGKGTACKVVENQGLMDSMDISPKLKEEVRKLLNSKHLFFREMCAYHNSCGHGGGAGPEPGLTTDGTTSGNSVSVAEMQDNSQSIQHQQQQQQLCSHWAAIAASSIEQLQDDDDDDEDDEEDDEEEEDEEELDNGGRARKRARTVGGLSSNSQALQQFNGELMGMLQDGGKKPWEKKQWMKTQLMQLEEQGLKFQIQALQLEKQRLKWIRFSSKKKREMEKMKIVNERKRLENERMVLLVRQKEIELLGERNPSCVTS